MSTLRHSCHSSAARGKPLTDLLGQTAHLHKYGDLYCGSRFQSLSLQEGLVFLPKNVSFSWYISLLCDQNVENILQSKNILNLNLNFGNRIYASHFLYSHQYSENYSSFSSLETSMFCDTEKWYLMCSSSMICHWFFSFQSLTFLTIYTLHKKKGMIKRGPNCYDKINSDLYNHSIYTWEQDFPHSRHSRVWTQGFTVARQMLYCLSHSTSPSLIS
jgi:hypothetical protein